MSEQAERKRIVITGCTRGLGRALAEFMASRGAVVFGCGRNGGEIGSLNAELGEPHEFSTVDVSDDTEVETWAQRILAGGAPDFLINNASVIAPNAPLWEVSLEDFSRVLDINVKGVANVIRHFTPAMIGRRSGVIVNFSSGWGRSTSPEVAPYCASKWAVEGLTKALAQELPSGVAAVALNPGIIDTGMLRSCFGDAARNYPRPEEWVKRAGPLILSLRAANNGQSLNVPGVPTD